MKSKLAYLGVAGVIGITGYALVIIYAGWQTALGIALCFWANNMQMRKP